MVDDDHDEDAQHPGDWPPCQCRWPDRAPRPHHGLCLACFGAIPELGPWQWVLHRVLGRRAT